MKKYTTYQDRLDRISEYGEPESQADRNFASRHARRGSWIRRVEATKVTRDVDGKISKEV